MLDRTAERARPLAGAVLAADPAEAVRDADVVVTMLGDGDDVHAVMEQAAPGLRAGQVWAQTTTVGVAPLASLAELADRHGLLLVDAPVVGTCQPAEDGPLLILAAGTPAARAVVQPVSDAVGRRTRWVADEAGGAAASRLKLVVNSWVLAVTAGAAEELALARGLDVDPLAFLDTVGGGPLDLPYLQVKAKAILAEDWETSFSLANAAKDADLVVAAAEAAGVRLDVAAGAAARYRRAGTGVTTWRRTTWPVSADRARGGYRPARSPWRVHHEERDVVGWSSGFPPISSCAVIAIAATEHGHLARACQQPAHHPSGRSRCWRRIRSGAPG